MEKVTLFKKDSVEDLICRGYKRDYILQKTGVDVGYNASGFKTALSGIDRRIYKLNFVKENFSKEFLLSLLEDFANGVSKDNIISKLGLSGNNLITLSEIYSFLDLLKEFLEADAKSKHLVMKNGMIKKYGVDNPFKDKAFSTKASQAKKEKYFKQALVPISKSEIKDRIYYDNGNFPEKYDAKKIGMRNAVRNMLIDSFGETGFIENYKDERYPFEAKFYVPEKDLFIEFFLENQKTSYHWYSPKQALNGFIINNAGQTYDKHAKTDKDLALEWKNSKDKQLNNNYIEWTKTMNQKRATARRNNLNYVVYWSNSGLDAFLHFDLGYPDAQDWKREGSYIPVSKIGNLEDAYPRPEKLGKGSAVNIKIAKYYQANVFYKPDLNVWNANENSRVGTTQLHLWANRRFYIGKRPSELTVPEVLRGLNIMRTTVSFTTYPSEGFTHVLEKYNVKSVADPCAGWLERLATCAAYEIPYYGVDINSALKKGYDRFISDFKLSKQHFFVGNSTTFPLKDYNCDAVITCSPYFNREEYSDEEGAADGFKSYEDFLNWWSKTIDAAVGKDTRIFAFQMHEYYDDKYSSARYFLAKDMSEILKSKGWEFIEAVPVSVGRVSHMNRKKDGVILKENLERMLIFKNSH